MSTITPSTGPPTIGSTGSTGKPAKPRKPGWVNDLVKSTHWLSPWSTYWRGVDEIDRTDDER